MKRASIAHLRQAAGGAQAPECEEVATLNEVECGSDFKCQFMGSLFVWRLCVIEWNQTANASLWWDTKHMYRLELDLAQAPASRFSLPDSPRLVRHEE